MMIITQQFIYPYFLPDIFSYVHHSIFLYAVCGGITCVPTNFTS